MFEKICSTALIVVAFIILGVSLYDRIGAHSSAAAPDAHQITGKPFTYPQGYSNTEEPTLVMAMSTQCHFCTASMPFYRQLADLRAQDGFRMLAILPQDVPSSQDYLAKNGVVVDHIISQSLGQMGIPSTPTLLLVGRDGRVQNVWVGLLDESAQSIVRAKLHSIPSTAVTR